MHSYREIECISIMYPSIKASLPKSIITPCILSEVGNSLSSSGEAGRGTFSVSLYGDFQEFIFTRTDF